MKVSTMRELLVQAEETWGEEIVIRYKSGKGTVAEKSYTDLRKDSEHFSDLLETLKVRGGHVALIGPTSYEWILSYFGTVNSGSVAVPLDASLPAADVCELVDRADAVVLVSDEARKDVLEAARIQCPKLRYLISMQKTEDGDGILALPKLMEMTLEEMEPGTGARADLQPDQLASILFTSGTTGKSKGVMLTHRNLAENATCLDMKFPERSVLLSVLPVHHAYCLSMDILKGISSGSVICINDSLFRMAANIKLFRPNIMLMVPMMIETLAKKLAAAGDKDPKMVKEAVFGEQFHTICSGGAYLQPELLDLFAKYDIAILQGYGMTECSPVISTTLSWNIRKGSVGQLLPNCEARVVDGELQVRGSSVMQGYYQMPEETAETLQNGWLLTGDLGYVDEDGFLFLTGRKKNLIITKNGENVSPEELENKLLEQPLIREILVREAEGVIEAEVFPDEEEMKAQGLAENSITEALQKLIDGYNEQAPAYKRIYRLKVRNTEFSKTPSKKIKRY